jgi:hypothetical protein
MSIRWVLSFAVFASLAGCEFVQQPARDSAARAKTVSGGASTGGGSTGGGSTGGGSTGGGSTGGGSTGGGSTGGGSTGGGSTGGGSTGGIPTVTLKYSAGRTKFVGNESVGVTVSSCAGISKVLMTSSSTAQVAPDLSTGMSCQATLMLPEEFSTSGSFTRHLWFYNAAGARIGSGSRAVSITVDRTGPDRPTFGWKNFFDGKIRSKTVVGTFAPQSSDVIQLQEVLAAYSSANCTGTAQSPASGSTWAINTASSPASVTITTNAENSKSYSFKIRLTDNDQNVSEYCSSVSGGQAAPTVEIDSIVPTASVSITATQPLMVQGTTASFNVSFTDNLGIESLNLSPSSFSITSSKEHSCSIGTIGASSGIGTLSAKANVAVTGCKSGDKFKLRLLAGQGARDYGGNSIAVTAESQEVEAIAPVASMSITGVGVLASAGDEISSIQVKVTATDGSDIKAGKVRLELLDSSSITATTVLSGHFQGGASFVDAALNPDGGGARFPSVRIMRRGKFKVRASFGTLQTVSPELRVSWQFLRGNNAPPALTSIDGAVTDGDGNVYSLGTGVTSGANQQWSSGTRNVVINAPSGTTTLLLQKQDRAGTPLKLAYLPNVAPSTVVDSTNPESPILLRQQGKLIVVGRFTSTFTVTASPLVKIGAGPFIARYSENLVLERIASLVTTASTCQYSGNNLRLTSAASSKLGDSVMVAGYFGVAGSTAIDVCLSNGTQLNSRGYSDIFVAETMVTDEDFGEIRWHQVAASPNYDQALAVAVDPVEGFPIIGGFHNPANTEAGRTRLHLAETGDESLSGTKCPTVYACEAMFVAMVSQQGFLWWHQAGTGAARAENRATNRVLTLQVVPPKSLERDTYAGRILVGGVVSGIATYTIASFGSLTLSPSDADGFVGLMTYNFRDLTPAWSKVYKVGGTAADSVRSVQIGSDSSIFIAGEFRSSDLRFQDMSTQAISKSCTAYNCSDLYMIEFDGTSSTLVPKWSRKISSTGSDFLSGLLLSDIAGGYVYGQIGARNASAGGQQNLAGDRDTNNAFLTRIGAGP